jgi:hypothetical protein
MFRRILSFWRGKRVRGLNADVVTSFLLKKTGARQLMPLQ